MYLFANAKIASVVVAALLLGGNFAVAHEEHEVHDHDSKPASHYLPSERPDRIVLTWADDPTTTINITWRVAVGGGKPVVEFAQASKLVGNLKDGTVPMAKSIAGSAEEFKSDLGTATICTAQLTGLQPKTMYSYRVGDGDDFSEWLQFRTASADDSPFTFVYFGDAQNAIRPLWSRVIREANQHAPRADFMLHAGDLVNNGEVDGEWGEWFEAGGWLNGMIPVVATPGNHEYVDSSDGSDNEQLTLHWRPQFQFPENGPKGLEESTYWFDYQGARIISLNSNEKIDYQIAWLEKVLSDENRPKWTIVTFHHPVFSAAKDRDNPGLRKAWKPIFDQYGVDLVLQGHDHTYARSKLGGPAVNVATGVRTNEGNAVYVVSVSGPKMYPLQDRWDAARVASGVQLFQVIKVSPKSIDYEARLATGELYDAFRLTKSTDGTNSLEDLSPDRPEIRTNIGE